MVVLDRLQAASAVELPVRRRAAAPLAVVALAVAALVGCGPARSSAGVTPTPVIVAAGDLAGPWRRDAATAALVEQIGPTLVLALGDNAYPAGTIAQYRRFYGPTWGRFKAITRPVPGNHDYATPRAAGYFRYFGRAAGARRRGYYSFDLGTWHLVALNSEIAIGARSAQLRWLARDLRASRAACTLAYFHRPRFSAGRYGDASSLKPVWRVLYRAGVDVVLSGHDHNYQRFRPLDPDGHLDRRRGIREWIVGTGGRGHYRLHPDRRRVAGADRAFGVLRLTLHARRFDFAFVPVANMRHPDAGTAIRCH